MFVQEPSPSLMCPICQDLYSHPVIITQCNHTFCQQCLLKSLDQTPESCPMCRTRLREFHSNLALQSLIDELLMYCPFQNLGCTASCTRSELENHMNSCKFKMIDCVYHSLGCEFKSAREDMDCHLAVCVFEKLKRYMTSTESRIKKLENIILVNFINKQQQVQLEYQDEPQVESRFPEGTISCHQTLNSPSSIASLAQQGQELFAGCYDGSISVYDMQTGLATRILQGHRLSVWALALHNQTLYSAGSDETIKVWNNGSTPTLSLDSNQGKIYSLAVSNNHLFSASSKNTIKIWDLVSNTCVGQFHGHTGGVNTIKILGDKLISGSSDQSIKVVCLNQVWDIQTLVCEKTIAHHGSDVLDLSVNDNSQLFCSTYDSAITVYGLDNFQRQGQLCGHKWEVWRLQTMGNALFSGSHDHTIKRWDVRKMRCDIDLLGHHGYIHSLVVDSNRLISGSADKTIKIWS